MKKIIILAIVCSILITFSSCNTNEKPTYYHTEDVADFNKGIYSLEGYACFNYGVPAEAEVMEKFSAALNKIIPVTFKSQGR